MTPTDEAVRAVALRACLFCGGRAKYQAGFFTGYIMCLKCEVMGPNIAEADAIAAWNTRAAAPTPPAASLWLPIGSAPRGGTPIWALDLKKDQYRQQFITWWHTNRDGERWQDDADSEPEPTHWQALPLPPTPD